VLARHRGIEGPPGAAKREAEFWSLVESLLPHADIEAYTQALMDLGATVCLRESPRCDLCPLARDCVAGRDGRTATLPSPRPTAARPQRAVRVLVIERAGAILLEKRPAAGIWAGLWSLPEVGTDADIARYCKTRFAANVVVGEELPVIEHAFTHFRLTIRPQRIAARTWPSRVEAPGLAWLTRDDALATALPAPIRRLLATL
jgi:A/G-specific adenine glycosylase